MCSSAAGEGMCCPSNSRWCVSDPLPPSSALPLSEGENKAVIADVNLPLVRGRRERSERGGRSHTILICSLSTRPKAGLKQKRLFCEFCAFFWPYLIPMSGQ